MGRLPHLASFALGLACSLPASTLGLPCEENSHCDAGQVCEGGICQNTEEGSSNDGSTGDDGATGDDGGTGTHDGGTNTGSGDDGTSTSDGGVGTSSGTTGTTGLTGDGGTTGTTASSETGTAELACSEGAVVITASPSGTEVVCADETETTCQWEFETLCPLGWELCTPLQHANRNAGWDFDLSGIPAMAAVYGEIYCRYKSNDGTYEGSQYGIRESWGDELLSDDTPLNCTAGSKGPGCSTSMACGSDKYALCCLPTPSCGNNVVDSVEEDCDDGNSDETDDCLNSCTWRVPYEHGYTTANGCCLGDFC